MQTQLSPEFASGAEGKAAADIIKKCVHCGFCNATCPTYQLLGDELDGPRGRIYLIKQVLEGAEVTRSTQQHLDRCLTCLNCETTCPSGVEYGKLVAIGRELVDERVERPAAERVSRWLLREGLTSALFAPALRLGRLFRGLLPMALKAKLPVAPGPRAAVWPLVERARKMLLLAGCVQPAMLPNVNSATARVLDAAGIQTLVDGAAGCCGALREHLGDHAGALDNARRNIDVWWPMVADGTVEAIVMNASACGLQVRHYGEALRGEPAYAEKAARISALTRDLSELLPELVPLLAGKIQAATVSRLALHLPCTLQHGQGLRVGLDTQLAALGFQVKGALAESHLCCGSAGTYSVLQPALATQLRDRKLQQLTGSNPECIVSANVGCIQHLQSGTALPVRHWIEVVDEALEGPAG